MIGKRITLALKALTIAVAVQAGAAAQAPGCRADTLSLACPEDSLSLACAEDSLSVMYRQAMAPLRLSSGLQATLDTFDMAPDVLERELTFALEPYSSLGNLPSIYSLPYSVTGRVPDWHRMWINTAVLTGAFIGTLAVLECLPEDATTWNRAALQKVPLFKRWWSHVYVKGPEWDHDNPIFNYVLHPYAGAVYYMSARSCGFNAWQSLLYCSLISNVGWEFGIEAFMERPSYQDLVITPVVGSLIGEGFYRVKRSLVAHDYHLLGSRVLGNIVAFLVDPVNEVVGLFAGNPARQEATRLASERRMADVHFSPMLTPGYKGFTLSATF